MIIKNNKILKVSAIATILSIGLLSAGYTLANKNITLVVKGKETEISTLKSNVEDVLAEQNVKYDKNDIISLPLDQKISDGDKIEVIKVTEKTIKENKEVPFEVNIVEDKDIHLQIFAQALCPIISEGDALGAVVMLAKDEKQKYTNSEKMLVVSAADFIGKQMQA